MNISKQRLIEIIKEEVMRESIGGLARHEDTEVIAWINTKLNQDAIRRLMDLKKDLIDLGKLTEDQWFTAMANPELRDKLVILSKQWSEAAKLKTTGHRIPASENIAKTINQIIKESGGVAGNFGGRSGGLGAVGGRADGPDSPDHDLQGPQQNAEDSLIGLMIELGQMLDVWEKKDYPSDEDRYKSYFSDLQGLLSKYDPCAHHGKRCDEAHPNQTHEECIEVTINDALQEVYSKRQRRWACAQKNKPASKRKKGLSKKEAGEMCKGPMKTKKGDKK